MSLYSTGQGKVPTYFLLQAVPELKLDTKVPDTAFVEPFRLGIGNLHGVNQYQLNRDGSFYYTFGVSSYKGTWSFDYKKSLLALNFGKKKKDCFHILRFLSYLYLVRPNEVEDAVNDFNRSKEKHQNLKPREVDPGGKLFTSDDIVAVELSQGRFWIH